MEKKIGYDAEKVNDFSSERREAVPNKTEVIAITDTHNDYEAIVRNLRIHGVINERGEWMEGAKNVKIIHTGDVVNKTNPDKQSLEYIVHLKQTAPESCSVEVLAGNHEIEYLMNAAGVAEEGSERKLIADNMSFLGEDGPILYVHGHPSRTLLKKILSKGMTGFNEQFKEAMQLSLSGNNEKLKRFSFKKKDLKKDEKPYQKKVTLEDYYKIHGPEIQRMLLKLGYRFVVHGHASQQGGVQKMDEFPEMPEITFINNDVSVSSYKKLEPGETAGNQWGSLKITMTNADGKSAVEEITVVNKNTYTDIEKNMKKADATETQIDLLVEELAQKGETSLAEKMDGLSREDLLNVAMGIRRFMDEPLDETAYSRFALVYALACTRLEALDEET